MTTEVFVFARPHARPGKQMQGADHCDFRFKLRQKKEE